MIRTAVYLNLQCSEGLLCVKFHEGKLLCTVLVVFTLPHRGSGSSKRHVARIMKDKQNVMGKATMF
jgi:hypothetical protein